MITKDILQFLQELKQNNNREWFAENKKQYEKANEALLSLVKQIIPVIQLVDPTIGDLAPKDCVFRIYRDTRFSPDKTPYKTNMGAYFARGGKKSAYAGYYMHLEPGNCMLAGGIWMPEPEVLKKIRQEIYYNSAEFKTILNSKSFIENFGALSEDGKLKNPPRDFPADFPDIDLLKNKNFTMYHSLDDKAVCAENYLAIVSKTFEAMKPINDFLNKAFRD
ncbi:MAG: DUF2461 domain-containing protein [Bacteroidota bacterium]|nr:DUF2461 domain-containing protein [Bacteroidota bacterium]